MADWGYKPLAKNRAINFNTNDMTKARELQQSVTDLNTCIACGQCCATCTAGALTRFNIRLLHTLVRRGEYAGAKEEAEKCMLCGKCTIVCPRGINTRKVILTLRNIL